MSWLDDDGLFAHCLDAKGRRYVIDARSAVSLSALSEGQRITVEAYPSGLVRSLVFDTFDAAATRQAAAPRLRGRAA